MKIPNLISAPESDGENDTKLENTLGYYPGERSQLSKADQHSNSKNTEYYKDIQEQQPKDT